jgi:hypothetical protein
MPFKGQPNLCTGDLPFRSGPFCQNLSLRCTGSDDPALNKKQSFRARSPLSMLWLLGGSEGLKPR